MKLLITSIDAIIDKQTGLYFEGIKESLHFFKLIKFSTPKNSTNPNLFVKYISNIKTSIK